MTAFQSQFNELSDEELIKLWKNPDAKDELYLRSLPVLHRLIMPFKQRGIDGLDSDDLLQEASYAFTKAALSYDPARNASFKTYLWICARSHMLTLARQADDEGDTVSLDEPIDGENSDLTLTDTLAVMTTPEEDAVNESCIAVISSAAKRILSKNEYEVFKMRYISEMKPAAIAESLNCSAKSVENALSRIRRKLKNAGESFEMK